MSYFTTRPRAYSKPTREEIKELSNHLLHFSADELRHIVVSAAGESSDVARLLVQISSDMHPSSGSPAQQVVQFQDHERCSHNQRDSGLLTPTDLSEDSEMSGQEKALPTLSNHASGYPGQITANPSIFTSTTYSSTSLSLPKRSNKRKTLSDRDDNIPTLRSDSSTSKKWKPTNHTNFYVDTTIDPHTEEDQCLNCGFWISHSEFDNLHNCIFHPGQLENNVWSCCRSSGTQLRGCLITRHRDPNRDNWRPEPNQTHQSHFPGILNNQASHHARLASLGHPGKLVTY